MVVIGIHKGRTEFCSDLDKTSRIGLQVLQSRSFIGKPLMADQNTERKKNPTKKKGVTKEQEKHGQPPTKAVQSSEKQEDEHVELRTSARTKVQGGQHQVDHGELSSMGWITPFKIGRSQGPNQLKIVSDNSFQMLNKSNEVNSPTPRSGQTVGGGTIFLEGNG
uniref:Uncharacterized protein n=1 Tax=Solanum lycopersicum TaxID=4081 RepID=K4D0W7_SOLLC